MLELSQCKTCKSFLANVVLLLMLHLTRMNSAPTSALRLLSTIALHLLLALLKTTTLLKSIIGKWESIMQSVNNQRATIKGSKLRDKRRLVVALDRMLIGLASLVVEEPSTWWVVVDVEVVSDVLLKLFHVELSNSNKSIRNKVQLTLLHKEIKAGYYYVSYSLP